MSQCQLGRNALCLGEVKDFIRLQRVHSYNYFSKSSKNLHTQDEETETTFLACVIPDESK